MTALNFQRRFVEAIRSGEKRQTIRRWRKDHRIPYDVGRELQLYVGMQTAKCELIARAVVTERRSFQLDREDVIVGGKRLNRSEFQELARADGFKDADDCFAFFEKAGLPFDGHLIKWRLLGQVEAGRGTDR